VPAITEAIAKRRLLPMSVGTRLFTGTVRRSGGDAAARTLPCLVELR
jgi:hypothetical protein